MKYLLNLLLFVLPNIHACLHPIQKLSLLHSIRDGQLRVHASTYECPSFVKNAKSESTFFIYKKDANKYLREFLTTNTFEREFWDDFKSDRKSFADKHPELFNDETYNEQIQDEYVTLWVKAFKSTKDITRTEGYIKASIYSYIRALINNNKQDIQHYSALLSQYYIDTQECVIT